MKKSNKKYCLLCLLVFVANGFCARTLGSEDEIFELSLEELLDVIVIASKKEERIFDSPMAASVLSATQIAQSGVTSIPEALKLVPGVIVREQSSGNYDVHIRGLDNIPPNSIIRNATNSLTLVMVDNRVVYNHFSGGTFWEALPIGIEDVERIEIIRGAASAMYGPNAVTGVINIVTRRHKESDKNMLLSIQKGDHNSVIADLGINYAFTKDWNSRLSLNVDRRDRQSTEYYEWFRADYVSSPEQINALFPFGPLEDPQGKYPDPDKATDKHGANVYLNGTRGDYVLDLSAGLQHSENQKIYDDIAATPFTVMKTKSWYFNAKNRWKDYYFNFSYEKGKSDTLGYRFGFDYNNVNVLLESHHQYHRWTIQPQLQFRRSEYAGEAFSEEESIHTRSAGVRSEYTNYDFRFIATARADDYNISNKVSYSYILGGTYKFSESFLAYSFFSQAHQEPFMSYTFEEIFFPLTPDYGLLALGSESLDLVTVKNFELGARWKFNASFELEVEAFSNRVDNYQVTYKNGETTIIGSRFVEIVQYQNVPTEATQKGLTVNAKFSGSSWRGSFFITWQKTDIEDIAEFENFELASLSDMENKNTPSYFGGAVYNYSGFGKWNINLSTYFFDKHEHMNDYSMLGAGRVENKYQINSKLSYKLMKDLDIYLNVKNLLDNDSREFAFADEVGRSYFLGFRWGM